MNEEFCSIGRGNLNINGKFYCGLDYEITDFMRSLEEENKQLKADYGNKAQVERDLLLLEKQDLINYLKEKKEEYIKLYNISCDIIDFDRYECLKILCEEILSKIEKSDN